MRARVRLSSLVGFAALAAFTLAGNGCGDDWRVITEKKWPPPPRFLPRTSPENLLHNLELAYQHRNIAEYESLLARNFTFVLSAEDPTKPDLPDSWGREAEIRLHLRLFDAEFIQTLALDFAVGDLDWDPVLGTPTILTRHVNIYIYGSTPGHPTEVSENHVQDSCSRFWFVRNPWTTGSRQDSVLTIVRWEDQPVADSCSVAGSFSWGALKAGAW